MKSLIVFFMLLFPAFFCPAEERKPEIVKKELAKASMDSVRIRLLIELGDIYMYAQPDSSIGYFNMALVLSEKTGNKRRKADIYKMIGVCNDILGKQKEALSWYLRSADLFLALKDSIGLAGATYNSASIYLRDNNFPEAMKYYQKALRLYEQVSNYPEGERNTIIAYCYLNMGIVFEYQKDVNKAEMYYTTASEFFLKANDSKGYVNSLNNIAGTSMYRKDYKRALVLYDRAIDSCITLNDSLTLSKCYNNKGNVYYNMSDYNKAREYYEKSVEIKKLVGNIDGAAKSLNNLAAICLKTGLYPPALKYCEEALKIGDSLKNYEIIMYVSETFSKVFERTGKIAKALEYYKIFKSASDSLINQSRNEKIEELTALFESEKKQLQIEKMQKDVAYRDEALARKSAENKKQQQLLIFVIAGLMLMAGFSVLLYRLFLQKKKANHLLSLRNTEIIHQKEEIESQRDEIEAQRDHIADINKELTSSILYASQIQNAVLPKRETISGILGDYFLLYMPRNVVSGDFFWFTKAGNKIIAAIADCTGHGVPGALMSMMGIAFLRDIVIHQGILSPGEILEKLRKNIILSLQQRGETGEQKDGMDLAVISIDTDTSLCTYSGANNPMYIVTGRKSSVESQDDCGLQTEDCRLIEFKADRMPISIHNKMGDFTEKQITLEKGDMVYLFSDGYADQFGGNNCKKYLSSRFRQKLVSIYNLSTRQQENELEKELVLWEGDNKQTDDITVLGIRI